MLGVSEVKNMLAALAPPAGNPPLPADAVKIDANKNGLVERGEAAGQYSEPFAMFDDNRDEVLSGGEIARGSVSDVYAPTMTYTDRHTVTLGGKRVTMTYLGVAHGGIPSAKRTLPPSTRRWQVLVSREGQRANVKGHK